MCNVREAARVPGGGGPLTELAGRQFQEAKCRVLANSPVNPEYRHMVLEASEALCAGAPGQFFHLHCPQQGDEAHFLPRPMSIYRSDAKTGRLEFLYKVVGKGTRSLSRLQPEDTLKVMGPLGRGFSFDAGTRHVVQVARGVGLATLAPLAEAAVAQGIRLTAILSARTPDLLMSVDYLRAVGADVLTVTDQDGSSDPARIEAELRRLIEDEGADYLATCGSNRLLVLVRRLAGDYGLRGEVALEQAMGCGIGMCFACVREFNDRDGGISYRRVCWDGPVFDVQEVPSW